VDALEEREQELRRRAKTDEALVDLPSELGQDGVERAPLRLGWDEEPGDAPPLA